MKRGSRRRRNPTRTTGHLGCPFGGIVAVEGWKEETGADGNLQSPLDQNPRHPHLRFPPIAAYPKVASVTLGEMQRLPSLLAVPGLPRRTSTSPVSPP